MQTDELRAELAELANEVAPFEGDLRAVRRRVMRRRVVIASVTAVSIVVAVSGALAATRPTAGHVNVAGNDHEVEVVSLPRVDAIVQLPARATSDDVNAVQNVLETTPAVQSYARLRPGSLASLLSNPLAVLPPSLRAIACNNPTAPSFAVELSRPATSSLRDLTEATGPTAVVTSWPAADSDFEVFMRIKATGSQVAAVSSRLHSDPDVSSVRFIDHVAAYREFRRLFHDQPALIESETPAGLPESFRVVLRNGVAPASVAPRYRGAPGVSTVIIVPNPFAVARVVAGAQPQSCPKQP